MRCFFSAMAFFFALAANLSAAEPLKVLIVDGQNNHDWKATTPILRETLEKTGLFKVDVATSGPKDTTGFRPKFSDYAVVVSNYNGKPWSKETQEDFVRFVKNGGGLVVVHAANNSFPEWPEYNEMIGLGGWGGRSEKDGPYIRYAEGKVVRDTSKGNGGSHGAQHEFVLQTADADHPIMKGLPKAWRHTTDELYDRLRGPAKNFTLLACANSAKSTGGTGLNEPILFTIDYGKGRVFHTTMGHSTVSMKCAGFQATLNRGTEWAATGTVTQPVPNEFPGANKTLPTK